MRKWEGVYKDGGEEEEGLVCHVGWMKLRWDAIGGDGDVELGLVIC